MQLTKKTLTTKNMVLCALFSALTAVSALVAIPLPFSPVPVTFQAFFALLSGAILGSKLGAVSQAVYVLAGTAGMPVFSRGSGGAGYLLGPTGGYLAGFILCAFFTGFLFERAKKPYGRKAFARLVPGVLLVYLSGIIWLMLITRLTPAKAFLIGVVPFIPGDIVKIFLAYVFLNKYNELYSNIINNE